MRARFRNAFQGMAPRVQNTRHRGYCIAYDVGAGAMRGHGYGFLKRIPMAKQISRCMSLFIEGPPGGEPWGDGVGVKNRRESQGGYRSR